MERSTNMSGRRRDHKNRILRNGESQRKDGRYAFKYVDTNGQVQFVYSWKLEKTDKLPAGKRDDISLREKEKMIQRDLLDGIVPNGGEMTVLQLVTKYVLQKTGVRHNTEAGYKTVINIITKESFGQQRIDKVKPSDARAWLIKLQKDGRSYSSIHSIRGVVRPAFQMAVDDDLIRKNPFEFQLATVIVNDSVTREAITRKQERAFLEFVKNDKHFAKYYEGIYILFKTGLRISEFVGLTIQDIDLQNRTINHCQSKKACCQAQSYTILLHTSNLSFSLIYFPLLILASAGFSASSGIPQVRPIIIMPGIRPSLQRIWMRRVEIPHFSDISLMERYFIRTSGTQTYIALGIL